MSQVENDLKILVFCCEYCSYEAADKAGKNKLTYPACARIVRVPCTGRIHLDMIVSALSKYDGVLVLGCHPGDCHFKFGNIKAYARMFLLKKALDAVRIDREWVDLEWVSAMEYKKFVDVVTKFVNKIASKKQRVGGGKSEAGK